VFGLFVWLLHGSQQCTQDYECGNVPFTVCGDCVKPISGITIDKSNNQIYYANARCSVSGMETRRNTTLKRVSTSGGLSTVVRQFPYFPGSSANPINIQELYDIIGEILYFSFTVVGSYSERNMNTLSITSGQFVGPFDIYTNNINQEILDFAVDLQRSVTYACTYIQGLRFPNRYSIVSNDGILHQSTDVAHYIYNNTATACSHILSKENSDEIYWTSINEIAIGTLIYQGSKSCASCPSPPALFSIPTAANEFILVGDTFYFSSLSGIWSSDKLGNSELIHNTPSYGLREHNGKLYINAGDQIISISLDGGNEQQITQDNKYCACTSNFYGPRCERCDGDVQWHQGEPYCVQHGGNGFPVSCREDYHCGNVPFTRCAGATPNYPGFCHCVGDLWPPPLCTSCRNSTLSVSWINGVPTCA